MRQFNDIKMSQTEQIKALLLHFPGLIAEGVGKQLTLRGTIKIKNIWYRLELHCPHFPILQQMKLHVQQLHQMCSFTTASNSIDPNWSVNELLQHLPKIIQMENMLVLETPITSLTNSAQNIFEEIAALYAPQNYKIHLDESCSRIRFNEFSQFEAHYLELELPSLQLREHSLPDGLPWAELLQKCPTLTALLQQYQKYLQELQPFYEHFAAIDELCYVVQPAAPTTKHNWRLFLLQERVFLKLQLMDPFAPLASMSLHIIGPTRQVERLRRTFSEGLLDWDNELDIHKNLLRIFDLCFFPMPTTLGEPNTAGGGGASQQCCNICYCYQLEHGNIPIISCDNTHCGLIFHAACLREWFNTLSDGKTFLDVSFGACPFCKTKLSTSFAELLEN